MALGANFNLELALDGTAQKGFAARAANYGFAVCRMDIFLHIFTLLILAQGDRPSCGFRSLVRLEFASRTDAIIAHTAM
jgi:hypothetical protein